MLSSNKNQGEDEVVLSPFSDAGGPSSRKKRKSKRPMWIALAVVLILILGIGGLFFYRVLNDPLRTLEPFPVGKYLDGYKPLAGARFRAELRVENDLGWKDGVGRLMTFSLREDPRPVAVMVPPQLSGIYFTKGQSYVAELEVKEGGLIYANSCRKN